MDDSSAHLFLPLLSPLLLPLISFLFPPFLTLNLRHQPLILLLIRLVPLSLLPQRLSRHHSSILPQLSDSTLLLSLVLLSELGSIDALAVNIVMLVWVE